MWRQAGVDAFHGDAVFYRANEGAEVAADAVVFVDAGDAVKWGDRVIFAGEGVELGDGRGGDAT